MFITSNSTITAASCKGTLKCLNARVVCCAVLFYWLVFDGVGMWRIWHYTHVTYH